MIPKQIKQNKKPSRKAKKVYEIRETQEIKRTARTRSILRNPEIEKKPIGTRACMSKKTNREVRNELRWARSFTGSERHKQEIKGNTSGTDQYPQKPWKRRETDRKWSLYIEEKESRSQKRVKMGQKVYGIREAQARNQGNSSRNRHMIRETLESKRNQSGPELLEQKKTNQEVRIESRSTSPREGWLVSPISPPRRRLSPERGIDAGGGGDRGDSRLLAPRPHEGAERLTLHSFTFIYIPVLAQTSKQI